MFTQEFSIDCCLHIGLILERCKEFDENDIETFATKVFSQHSDSENLKLSGLRFSVFPTSLEPETGDLERVVPYPCAESVSTEVRGF